MFVLIKIWGKREKISVKGELYFYDARYRISWTYRKEWTLLLCMSSYIYICQSTSLSPSSLLNYIPQGTSWLSFLLVSQRNAPCTLTCSSISRTLRVLSPFLHYVSYKSCRSTWFCVPCILRSFLEYPYLPSSWRYVLVYYQ